MTPRRYQRKQAQNRRKLMLLIVILAVIIIINPIKLFAYSNDEETAEIMANFILAEYERQKNTGDVDVTGIVKLAKRLDKTGNLAVTCFDGNTFKIKIFREVAGDEFIDYQDIVLN